MVRPGDEPLDNTKDKQRLQTVDAPIEWDQPGVLSIIVQGALFQGNMVETASHCRHWRELFPEAEIVLALSVTDMLTGSIEGGVFKNPRLVSKHLQDGHLQSALGVMIESTDKIGLSEHALPLPPIKVDSPKLNNMNLQIAAAQNGLSLASGTFVLRVRSDLIFLDRSFLDQFVEAEAVPRGETAVFRRRVMISWLFTLNPYTLERLPLHFSDWFHFGLTEDVRRIWQVPAITLQDGLHYKTHRHAAHSNVAERLFNVRLAVEQHVLYHCFRPSFPDLVLEYHNDSTSVDLAMKILIDNFSLCDLMRAHCVFEKYAGDFIDPVKRIHCLTREDWFALAKARDVDQRTILDTKIHAAQARDDFKDGLAFPRKFEAARLQTRDGRLVHGEIVGYGDGVLFFGPYTSLRSGSYLATVNLTSIEGSGSLTLKVSSDAGQEVLAVKTLSIAPDTPFDVSIPFDVTAPQVSKLEVVGSIKGLRGISVSDVTLSVREKLDPSSRLSGDPASQSPRKRRMFDFRFLTEPRGR